MTTRRTFIQETAATALFAATSVSSAMADARPGTNKAASVMARIKSVIRRDDTILRLGGNGATLGMTWTADDRQLVSIGEGGGWPGQPDDLYFLSALFTMSGSPQTAYFQPVSGFPVRPLRDAFRVNGSPGIFVGARLAIDRRLYLSMTNAGTVIERPLIYQGPRSAKLIYSTDNGQTLRNPDGSTPVVEPQTEKDEPQDVFAFAIFLQMGKGYEDNRDGYVYGYAGNGAADAANELVMFRVPKASILDRGAYEYFGGVRAGGASWVKDINARAAAHRLPPGWRCTSVVYNKPLGLYMMAAGWSDFTEEQEIWRWSPSRLGFWVASTPWGPWEQIHEESKWTPGNPESCALSPRIAPKWIAADGKSFWLVWTDFYHTDDYRMDFLRNAYRTLDDEEYKQAMVKYRTHYMVNYRFNVQRVDLAIA